MYPFKIAFEWTDEELEQIQSLSLMNMLDNSDDAFDLAQNINLGSGLTVIVAHGTGNKIGYKVFDKNGNVENAFYKIEDIAQELIDSNTWNGIDEVVLLACNAGTQTITSPAQELADQLQYLVWAPIGMVYFLKNGKFFVSKDVEINKGKVNKEELEYENQRKLWIDFLPITY